MKWSWEKWWPETVDCLGTGGEQTCSCKCTRNASWLPREVVGTEGSPQPADKTRSALKRWSSKCVWWTTSCIARNASFQAHLRPTASETLEASPSGIWSCSQPLAMPVPMTAEVREPRTAVLQCMWSGRCHFAVLAGDIVFLSPLGISLFLYSVILVFMDTHFSCHLIPKTSSREDTVIYLNARENLAGATLLRGGYVHLQWAPCWVISWLWPIFPLLWHWSPDRSYSTRRHSPSHCFGF